MAQVKGQASWPRPKVDPTRPRSKVDLTRPRSKVDLTRHELKVEPRWFLAKLTRAKIELGQPWPKVGTI